ncbi:MAG: metallopeptidase [Candidatus Levybacteria bacterium]|nr:metallopeptidase [Candidatus Levybacteria bacterium]
MEWQEASDIKNKLKKIINVINLPHVKLSRIYCYRSSGSKSKSYARIWSMPKVFQLALGIEPAYVIEVLSKHYDKLDPDNQIKVLIHELLHIPKNFSGSLLSHKGRNRHLGSLANKLFKEYKKNV